MFISRPPRLLIPQRPDLDFVQKSAEVLRNVIPAQAGIQWRPVINKEPSLGSGFRRSDGGNFPDFLYEPNLGLFAATPRSREFLHVAARRRYTKSPQACPDCTHISLLHVA